MPAKVEDISAAKLHERRERIFLLFSGIFLGTLAMLNIIGITRFIHIGPLALAVGVLPYPLTFLCTDFISEFYGRRRANYVVFVGMLLNLFILGILWLGQALPAMEFKTDLQRLPVVRQETVYADPETRKTPVSDPRNPALPLKRVVVPARDIEGGGTRVVEEVRLSPVIDPATGEAVIDPATGRPVLEMVDGATGQPLVKEEELYTRIFASTRSAVLASMLAYLVAQFVDVFLFHFWKRLTRGRHLWLRNNGSTMVSQLVDTSAVVLITFWGAINAGEMGMNTVMGMIWGAYLFKLAVAAFDTLPFYVGVRYLSRYLRIDPTREHQADVEVFSSGPGTD